MANSTLAALTAASALGGTELLYGTQAAADVKITANQLKTWASSSPTLVTPALGVATATSVTTPTVTLGTVSTTTGVLQLANSASANLTTIQAGNAAAARTYTWPTNFGASGTVLTDAAGNGTLSWAAGGGGSGITIGTSTITSGTTTRVLFDNAGVVGEYSISGTGNVAMTTSPTFVTPVLGAATATSVTASGLLQAGTTIGVSTDVLLNRDAANILARRNSTAAQSDRIYNTYTDASNNELIEIGWNIHSNIASIDVVPNGTGTQRDFRIYAGTLPIFSYANGPGTVTIPSPVTFATTNNADLGNTSFSVNSGAGDSKMWNAGRFGFTSTNTSTGTLDTILTRAAAANWRFGDVDVNGAPVAQTISFQGALAGSASNQAAANVTVIGSLGTGTGTVGSIILQSSKAAVSGTGQHTAVTGLTIKAGTSVLTSYTVANLPTAATAGAGATAFVTDASTTLVLGLGGAVAGGGANKVPVYSDGTNWLYG